MNDAQGMNTKYCHACGDVIDIRAEICPKCGVRQFYQTPPQQPPHMGHHMGGQQMGGSPYQNKPRSKYTQYNEKKIFAGIAGILFGAFGVHKFVLGYQNTGIIMLAVTLGAFIVGVVLTFALSAFWALSFLASGIFSLGGSVMGIIGLIEGIIYLTKSDKEFYETYIARQRDWF